MKRIIFALCLLVVMLSGCVAITANAKREEKERFVIEYVQDDFARYLYVITDTETGKQYLFVTNVAQKAGGLCLLEE